MYISHGQERLRRDSSSPSSAHHHPQPHPQLLPHHSQHFGIHDLSGAHHDQFQYVHRTAGQELQHHGSPVVAQPSLSSSHAIDSARRVFESGTLQGRMTGQQQQQPQQQQPAVSSSMMDWTSHAHAGGHPGPFIKMEPSGDDGPRTARSLTMPVFDGMDMGTPPVPHALPHFGELGTTMRTLAEPRRGISSPAPGPQGFHFGRSEQGHGGGGGGGGGVGVSNLILNPLTSPTSTHSSNIPQSPLYNVSSGVPGFDNSADSPRLMPPNQLGILSPGDGQMRAGSGGIPRNMSHILPSQPDAHDHFGTLVSPTAGSSYFSSPITSPVTTAFPQHFTPVTGAQQHRTRLHSPAILPSSPVNFVESSESMGRITGPVSPVSSTSPPTTPGFALWRVSPGNPVDVFAAVPRSSRGSSTNPAAPSQSQASQPHPSLEIVTTTGPSSIHSARIKVEPDLESILPGVAHFSPSLQSPTMGPFGSERDPNMRQQPQLAPNQMTRAQGPARLVREQVPPESWDKYKPIIRRLYLEERRPLKEVIQVMGDQYGFQATPKMYKTRFSQWGFVKNNTEEEVKKLLSMKFQRDAEGKVTEFVRNGRVVNIGTYLKRKGVTEYDLVDFETPADLPSYVRCRTPTPPRTPDYLRSPDLVRAQDTVFSNLRKAFMNCRQMDLETNRTVKWATTMHWGALSSDLLSQANRLFQVKDREGGGGHFLMLAFKQLEVDLRNLTPQAINELLLGMVRRDAGVTTALCKYLAAYFSTNFERSHPLRLVFACLYEVQQKHGPVTLSDLIWACVPTVAEELEAIYGRRHPYVARHWTDLALFYAHTNPAQLTKLADDLKSLMRAVEARVDQGGQSQAEESDDISELMALRYAVVQMLCAASPESEAARAETVELWNRMGRLRVLFPVRGGGGAENHHHLHQLLLQEHRQDQQQQMESQYCYHCVVKVAPGEKRCKERYGSLVMALERHCGVRVGLFFEEEGAQVHLLEHAEDVFGGGWVGQGQDQGQFGSRALG